MLTTNSEDARHLIEIGYGIWHITKDNNSVPLVASNYLVTDQDECIPTVWELADRILDYCTDNTIRNVNYLGVPMTIFEFVDSLQNFLDLERVEYLSYGTNGELLMNQAQQALIPELLEGCEEDEQYNQIE